MVVVKKQKIWAVDKNITAKQFDDQCVDSERWWLEKTCPNLILIDYFISDLSINQ